MAAAASSIFLSCRKRPEAASGPSVWTGLGGLGVARKIEEAVRQALTEFEPLQLNPVDETVACYGRALRVLCEHWPVLDGDEPVGPLRAMNEASRVAAEHQIRRITQGRLSVSDLDPETAMTLTLFGIWGLGELAYDEALNLSRSLNIALSERPAGYRVEGRMVGINRQAEGGRGRSRGARAEETGYAAPLVRKGSKLRLAKPEERDPRRLEKPQTDWDVLQGLIVAYRTGGALKARPYLDTQAAGRTQRMLDLLDVWAAEVGDPALEKEARTLRFELGPRS